MAVKGDKESGIFFLDRTTPGGTVPGGYNGDGSCSGTANRGHDVRCRGPKHPDLPD